MQRRLLEECGKVIEMEKGINEVKTKGEADIRLIREQAWIGYSNKISTHQSNYKLFPHYKIWVEAIKILESLGFKPFVDKEFKKRFKSLIPTHAWGNKNGLKFESKIYVTGFAFQFYQDINIENVNGGKYDCDRYKKMPSGIKNSFNHTVKSMIEQLTNNFNLKFYDQSNLRFPRMTAEERIIKHFRESSFTRNKIETLDQLESFLSDYDLKVNSKSGVDDILKCGQTRKFKGWDEKIHTGVIYHNINNMWWVITSKYKYTNIASFNILELVAESSGGGSK